MKKFYKMLSLILIVSLLSGVIAPCVLAEDSVKIPSYGFIDCNGVKIEYGVYGEENTEPLLLLHPNNGDMNSNYEVREEMKKYFKVISISCRCYGNSDRGEGNVTFEKMSDDIVCVLDYFGIDKVNIYGFSDGGNLGFVFTNAHPERVKSLVVMGSNINIFGTKTGSQIGIIWQYILAKIRYFFTGKEEYLHRADVKGLMAYQPNLKFSDLKKINVPFLNIYGEHDMIWGWHLRKITKSVKGAEELMVKGGGHGSMYVDGVNVVFPVLWNFYKENNIYKNV